MKTCRKIAEIKEPEVDGNCIICKTEKVFDSPLSQDHLSPIYIIKSASQKWRELQRSQLTAILRVHFKMDENEISEIVSK